MISFKQFFKEILKITENVSENVLTGVIKNFITSRAHPETHTDIKTTIVAAESEFFKGITYSPASVMFGVVGAGSGLQDHIDEAKSRGFRVTSNIIFFEKVEEYYADIVKHHPRVNIIDDNTIELHKGVGMSQDKLCLISLENDKGPYVVCGYLPVGNQTTTGNNFFDTQILEKKKDAVSHIDFDITSKLPSIQDFIQFIDSTFANYKKLASLVAVHTLSRGYMQAGNTIEEFNNHIKSIPGLQHISNPYASIIDFLNKYKRENVFRPQGRVTDKYLGGTMYVFDQQNILNKVGKDQQSYLKHWNDIQSNRAMDIETRSASKTDLEKYPTYLTRVLLSRNVSHTKNYLEMYQKNLHEYCQKNNKSILIMPYTNRHSSMVSICVKRQNAPGKCQLNVRHNKQIAEEKDIASIINKVKNLNRFFIQTKDLYFNDLSQQIHQTDGYKIIEYINSTM